RTPRIPQLELEFSLLVQGTASHDHPSRLQYSEVANDELRHVRHEDADPVALAETEGHQRGREPGRKVVQLGVGEGSALVDDTGSVREPGSRLSQEGVKGDGGDF